MDTDFRVIPEFHGAEKPQSKGRVGALRRPDAPTRRPTREFAPIRALHPARSDQPEKGRLAHRSQTQRPASATSARTPRTCHTGARLSLLLSRRSNAFALVPRRGVAQVLTAH